MLHQLEEHSSPRYSVDSVDVALCASCHELCPRPKDSDAVAFCEDCRSVSAMDSYPEDWVMLGGWD